MLSAVRSSPYISLESCHGNLDAALLMAQARSSRDGGVSTGSGPLRRALTRVGKFMHRPAWLLLVGMALASPPAMAEVARNVLVLLSYDRLLPMNVEGDAGIREGFAARPDLPVALSVEYLDNLKFSGEAYERTIIAYLRDKYALQPPEVLMVGADATLDLVLRHRSELFPRVPIVHMAVVDRHLQSMPPLPADVIGTPLTDDFVRTVEQAQRWHPKARRLVIVTGVSPWDRDWEARLRAQVINLPPGLTVEFFAGLPTVELQRRLRALDSDSIVFTPGYFRDGNGREFAPREAVRLAAAAAPVPVYGAYTTFLGTGIVGGRMARADAIGLVGAQAAIALLDGADPATVARLKVMPTSLQLDWRQLQRWGIPDKAVPADAIVHFREPSLWQAHRELVLLGIAVMLTQSALIVALLFERRRRRRTVADLKRSDELMRLAAQAANLSTWVLEEGSISSAGVAGARPATLDTRGPLNDFSETLARISPLDRPAVDAALRDARDNQGELDVEYRVQGADGEWLWQAARGRADQAKGPRLLGVAIDTTQRKRAEVQAAQDRAALYHMTRVSLLGQLSASIAHELNQPLAAILANAEAAQKMLEREPLDLAELRSICADIAADDQRAAQVIRRLGVLFKRGESVLEPLDVNELIRDTIEFTRSILTTRHVVVAAELSPTLPLISGDRVQLQQLLLNLMVNAADAMAELPEERRQLNVATALHDRNVTLCVTDCGPGVPVESMDKVFEPFWSTRPGGMGMGLAVCRSIVEAHRGRLTVAQAPAGGAMFCAMLPVQGST
jgi:C4-dicarboxylate-specific signal transduction histidine kinase